MYGDGGIIAGIRLCVCMFDVTHLHFGRKPASIIAPDIPRPLLLKSASVMRVSMVTAVLDPLSPLKVNFESAELN
jgi:hypothetical protein